VKANVHFWSYHDHFFLEWEIFQTNVIEKNKIRILRWITFLRNRAIYEIMWKMFVESGGPQMTIWRMRFICWVTKATDKHSDYVILTAFPRQQRLDESASMFRHTYFSSLVYALLFVTECLLSFLKICQMTLGQCETLSLHWAPFLHLCYGVEDRKCVVVFIYFAVSVWNMESTWRVLQVPTTRLLLVTYGFLHYNRQYV
jgi:hypothetical protein